jgi:hypothetical protein
VQSRGRCPCLGMAAFRCNILTCRRFPMRGFSLSIRHDCRSLHDASDNAGADLPCKGSCVGTWKKCAGTGIAGQRPCCIDNDVCVYKDASYSQCRPRSKPLPSWPNAKVITCKRACSSVSAVFVLACCGYAGHRLDDQSWTGWMIPWGVSACVSINT